jgi:UDP-glucose 4-epimerase
MTAVAESFAHPYEFTETNFIGTINLAEANLDNQNLRRFLFAGSSEEYGNQETFPIKETATLLPNTPYGISKVAADFYLQYLRLAYDFPACTVRPFNTMGRVENFNFVSEIIITQMLRNKEIIVLGDPSPVRDFLYLDDHVAGYLTILESKKLPKTVNLCSGRGVSIKELVAIISGLIGWEGEVSWTRSYRRPTEIFKLVGDNSLAKSLGWEPKFTLEEGLKLAIEKIREKIQLR